MTIETQMEPIWLESDLRLADEEFYTHGESSPQISTSNLKQ